MNLLYTGLAAAWLIWGLTLLRGDAERPTGRQALGWLLFASVAWLCLTLAHRIAGQAAASMLLLAGGVAALLLFCGVALMYRVAGAARQRLSGFRHAAIILIIAALLLPLPLAGEHVPLSYWGFKLLLDSLSIDRIPGTGLYVLTGLLLFCVLIWPFSWRLRLRTKPAPKVTTP